MGASIDRIGRPRSPRAGLTIGIGLDRSPLRFPDPETGLGSGLGRHQPQRHGEHRGTQRYPAVWLARPADRDRRIEAPSGPSWCVRSPTTVWNPSVSHGTNRLRDSSSSNPRVKGVKKGTDFFLDACTKCVTKGFRGIPTRSTLSSDNFPFLVTSRPGLFLDLNW